MSPTRVDPTTRRRPELPDDDTDGGPLWPPPAELLPPGHEWPDDVPEA